MRGRASPWTRILTNMPDRPEEVRTVAERLYRSLSEFSPAEKKVSRALLANYPGAGLGTAASLGKESHTSASTVVRFITRLGFSNFGDFQDALRAELAARLTSSMPRAETSSGQELDSDAVSKGGEERARLVTETFERLPRAEITNLLTALTHPHNHVYIAGGQYSGFIAQLFQAQLSKLRSGVFYLADPLHRDLGIFEDLRRRDLLILFDVRRYDESAKIIAKLGHEKSTPVALITDSWLSPSAADASIVLPTVVEAPFADSLVPCLALVEAIVTAVAQQLPTAFDRLRRIEEFREHLQ